MTDLAQDRARERALDDSRSLDRRFAIGLARAAGGALVFSLPLLMTMEMWWLGFHVERLRLLLLVLVMLPFLVGLSHVSGFEDTFELMEDVVDALVAWAVGSAMSALVLALFGELRAGMSLDEVTGKVALQAVPASMGALLARSTLGGEPQQRREREGVPGGYWGELFLMLAGALFLAFNVAPTEEIILLAYMMAPWQALLLAALSLLAMHAFVYAVEFHGQERVPHGVGQASVLLRFTVVGYAIVLVASAYVLWTFGRLDGVGLDDAVASVLVLAFPAAVGAAAARLIL
jgi:putative integral membrane protein (TIGR02587 family)